jgi:hypothetical protein
MITKPITLLIPLQTYEMFYVYFVSYSNILQMKGINYNENIFLVLHSQRWVI